MAPLNNASPNGSHHHYVLWGFALKLALVLLVVFAISGCSAGSEVDDRPSIAEIDKGEAIAELVCSNCHAIGVDGSSPHSDATPFRDISKNYTIDMLADSLERGIIVDHPDMPPFSFPRDEVDALIDYMKRIQSPQET